MTETASGSVTTPHAVSAKLFMTARPVCNHRPDLERIRSHEPGAEFVQRSYKFLLRPTAHQRAALKARLEDTRQLYNAALEERREAWRMGRLGQLLQSGRATKEIRAERSRDGTGAGRSHC